MRSVRLGQARLLCEFYRASTPGKEICTSGQATMLHCISRSQVAQKLGSASPRAEHPVLISEYAREWPVVVKTRSGDGTSAMEELARILAKHEVAHGPIVMEAECTESYVDGMRTPVSVSTLAAYLGKTATLGPSDAEGLSSLPYLAQAELFSSHAGGCPLLAAELVGPLEFEQPPYVINAWLGSSTASAMHHDPYDNLFVQCIGCKEVILLPPGDEGMYPLPRHMLQSNTSTVDPFRPDYSRSPLYEHREKAAIRVVCHPGDALFIPRRANLSSALSILGMRRHPSTTLVRHAVLHDLGLLLIVGSGGTACVQRVTRQQVFPSIFGGRSDPSRISKLFVCNTPTDFVLTFETVCLLALAREQVTGATVRRIFSIRQNAGSLKQLSAAVFPPLGSNVQERILSKLHRFPAMANA